MTASSSFCLDPPQPLQVSFNLLGLHPVTAMVQLEFDHLLDTMVASLQLQGPGIEGVALTEANLRKLDDQRRLRRPSTSSRLHWWNMIDKKIPYRIHVFRQICIVFVLCVCFFLRSWVGIDFWMITEFEGRLICLPLFSVALFSEPNT